MMYVFTISVHPNRYLPPTPLSYFTPTYLPRLHSHHNPSIHTPSKHQCIPQILTRQFESVIHSRVGIGGSFDRRRKKGITIPVLHVGMVSKSKAYAKPAPKRDRETERDGRRHERTDGRCCMLYEVSVFVRLVWSDWA